MDSLNESYSIIFQCSLKARFYMGYLSQMKASIWCYLKEKLFFKFFFKIMLHYESVSFSIETSRLQYMWKSKHWPIHSGKYCHRCNGENFALFATKRMVSIDQWSSRAGCLTLMLLVANLSNAKRCKKPEKWLKPWQTGTHLRVLSESFPRNTNMTGFNWFSKIFASLCFGWK